MSSQIGKKYVSLLKDTALFAISSFGSKLLVFLLTPLYTAVLLPEEFGIADLINTTIQFLYPILTLAITEATLRFALDKEKDRSKVFTTSLLFVIISVLVLLLFTPFFLRAGTQLEEYWGVFVASFFLFNIQACFSNFLKGIGKTKLFAIQGILHTITIIICNILSLIVFKWGLRGYLLSSILGYIIPILMSFFCGKLYKYITFEAVSGPLVKEMLLYSIPMIPTILTWAINTSIDKYMIIGMLGLSDSGIYSVAHKIPTIATTIVSVFLQAWQLSAISNYGKKGESEYYTIVFSGLNILCISMGMLLILFAENISTLLFAESYHSAWKCVPMLTIAAIFSSLSGFIAAAFRAAKKTKDLFLSAFIGAICNIALNAILIRAFGIEGAAVATATSFSIVFLVRFIMVARIVKIKINISKFCISYAVVALSALVTVMEVQYSATCVVIGLIVAMLLNSKEILQIMKPFWRKLLRRQ